jgi:ankyrin repeat protein
MTNAQKLSPDKQKDLDHCLIDAVDHGNTQTVRTLLAAGADVHAQDDEALRWAAEGGRAETVNLLLASGANVHARNDEALCLAAYFGHTETMEVLLSAGADVHAWDDRALYYAAYWGHTETVKVLLSAGANVHVWDDDALWWAAWNGHMETVQVMARHIFAPDSWHGKSRAEIEAHANALYDKIKFENPQPDRLRTAGAILLDCALCCWEHVRPAPPKIQITSLPAQPRPL